MPTCKKGIKMEATTELENLNSSNLSATTIKVRDAVIQKCEGKNLQEMTQFIKGLLEHEENDQKRLGVLAARVYLLREKIMMMKTDEDSVDDSAENIKNRHSHVMETIKMEKEGDVQPEVKQVSSEEPNQWMRVRIVENAEVNNVRFPAGVVIDAFSEDAQRLIDAGKAEIVEDDDSGLADPGDMGTEESPAEAVDTEAADTETADTNDDE
jgi:hypothetical protein